MSDVQYQLSLGVGTGVAKADVDALRGSVLGLGRDSDALLAKSERSAASIARVGDAGHRVATGAGAAATSVARYSDASDRAARTSTAAATGTSRLARASGTAGPSLAKTAKEAHAMALGFVAIAAAVGVTSLLTRVRDLAQDVARDISRVGSEFQQLRVQLETATGSMGSANAAMEEIKDFAKSTPFEVENLTKSWVRLVNFGIDPTERTLTSLGNIAAAYGKDISDFTEAVTAATTGETERLKQFAVAAKTEGDKITFTFRGVSETVRRDATEIADYFTRLGETEFAGGMERQAATVKGALSNVDDAVSSLYDTIAQRSGLLVVQEHLFRTVAEAIGDTEGEVGDLSEAFSNDLLPVIEQVSIMVARAIDNLSSLSGVIPHLMTVIKAIGTSLPGIGGLLRDLELAQIAFSALAQTPGAGARETATRDWFDELRKKLAEARAEAEKTGKATRNLGGDTGGLTEAQEKLLESLRNSAAEHEYLAKAAALGSAELAEAQRTVEVWNALQKAGATATSEFGRAIIENVRARQDAERSAAGSELIRSLEQQLAAQQAVTAATLEGEAAAISARQVGELAVAQAEAEIEVADDQIARVKELLALLSESAAQEAVNARTEAISRETSELGRRLDAYTEGERAVVETTRAIARERAELELLSGIRAEDRDSLRASVTALLDYREAVEQLEGLQAMQRQNAELAALATAWGRGSTEAQALNLELEIQRRLLAAGAEEGSDLAAAIRSLTAEEFQLRKLVAQSQAAAEAALEPWKNFFRGLQSGMADAVEGFLDGGLDSFEDFFDQVAQMGKRAIAEWVAFLGSQQLSRVLPESLGGLVGGGASNVSAEQIRAAAESLNKAITGMAEKLTTSAVTAGGELILGGATGGAEVAVSGAVAAGEFTAGGAAAAGELTVGGATAATEMATGGATAAAELIAGASTAAAELAAGGAAGGAGGVAGGVTGGVTGGTSGMLSAAGPWIAVAAIVLGIGYGMGWWGSHGRTTTGSVTLGPDLEVEDAWGQNAKVIMPKVREAVKEIVAFVRDVNLEMESFGSVEVEKRWKTYYVNGLSLAGKTADEIEDAIATIAIRTGEFGESVSEFLRAVLRGSKAITSEQLKAEIEFARMIEGFGKTDLEGRIAGLGREMDQIFAELARLLSGNLEQFTVGFEATVREEVNRWQTLRDEITGRQRTPAEEMEMRKREAELFNAERALRLADLKARVAELEAQKKIVEFRARLGLEDVRVQARLEAGRRALTLAELQASHRNLGFRQSIYEAELTVQGIFAKSMGATVQVMASTVTAAGTLLQAQIDALNGLIAAIEAIPPIDLGEIRIPGGGGKGSRIKEDREQLESILDAFDLAQLTGVEASLADINNRYEQNIKLAHGNADLLERVASMRERENEALRKGLREEVAPYLPAMEAQVVDPVTGATVGGSTGDWGVRVREIIDWADRIAEENEKLLKATGEAALTAEEIVAAAATRLNALIEDAIDSLGLPMEQARDKVRDLGDTIRFLEERLAAGAISSERFGEVMAGVVAQAEGELYALTAGILESMGATQEAAKFRSMMEKANFHLQVAQLNFLYQQYLALGALSKEAAEAIGEALGFINDPANWPNFDAPPPPQVTAPTAPTVDIAAERDRFLETLGDQIQEWTRLPWGPMRREAVELREEYEELRSEAQRLGIATGQLTAAYRVAVGSFVDDALEEFERLGESPLQSELTDLTDHFEDLRLAFLALGANADQMERLAAAQTAAMADFWERATEGIRGFLEELRDTDPRRSSEARFLESQANFRSLVARAQQGDLAAIEELEAAARAYREEATGFLGAGVASGSILDEIMRGLEGVPGVGSGSKPTAGDELVAASISRGNAYLGGIYQHLTGRDPNSLAIPGLGTGGGFTSFATPAPEPYSPRPAGSDQSSLFQSARALSEFATAEAAARQREVDRRIEEERRARRAAEASADLRNEALVEQVAALAAQMQQLSRAVDRQAPKAAR